MTGTDVDALWEPFRFFEAGHHRLSIMDPLTSDGLDGLIDRLGIANGHRVLDVACGHGELLRRIAGRWTVDGIGVDLSPWTIRRAHHRLSEAGVDGIRLVLGDGRHYLESTPAVTWDVICLIGAPWIWGGFEPSVAALAARLAPGGRLAVADVVATTVEVRDGLPAEFGQPRTAAECRAILAAAGLTGVEELPSTAEAWRDYDDRVAAGIEAWVQAVPGDRRFLDRRGDRESERAEGGDVRWSVWVGTQPLVPDRASA